MTQKCNETATRPMLETADGTHTRTHSDCRFGSNESDSRTAEAEEKIRGANNIYYVVKLDNNGIK